MIFGIGITDSSQRLNLFFRRGIQIDQIRCALSPDEAEGLFSAAVFVSGFFAGAGACA